MFYEKNEALPLYKKIKKKNSHQCFLLTAQIGNLEQISQNQFIILTIKWKKKLKEVVHPEDFGIVLNKGNLLVFVHNERVNEFKKLLSITTVNAKNKLSLHTDILSLKEYETSAIILE